MPKRFTDLNELLAAAGNDILVLVDVSENETKYITLNNLLVNAVDTADLVNLAVTTPKIADGAVTFAKRADDVSAYAYGQILTQLSGVKNLTPVASSGITFDGTSTYTVVTKGIYYIHGQQLLANSASAIYFNIQVNGVTKRFAYIPGNVMADANVSEMVSLNVGDTIRFTQSNASNSAWAGEHSGFQIFLYKRLP